MLETKRQAVYRERKKERKHDLKPGFTVGKPERKLLPEVGERPTPLEH